MRKTTRLRRAHRRGIAMMLVLVSIVMATILATAYLSSRDNSAAISSNAGNAAAARWAALSALETGIAILETETDWRTAHTNGVLLDAYPLAGALITLEVDDLESGTPPTVMSVNIGLTATAVVGGVRQTATAEAFVPLFNPQEIATVDLSEFAIFADDVTMSDSATVTRWPMAVQSSLGLRILWGTTSQASGSLELNDSAASIDTTLYHQDGSSSTVLINNSGPPIVKIELDDEIPIPDEPDPGVAYPSTTSSELDLLSESRTFTTDRRFEDVTLDNSQVTLRGDVEFIVENDLEVHNNSTVVIDGNVTLIVFDDFLLETGSAIELAPGAKVAIYFGDEMSMNNAYIGEERPDDTRDTSGYAPAIDLRRILLFGIENSGNDDERRLLMRGDSVLKGIVYAPSMDVEMRDDSAIYGSIATDDVIMQDNTALFYDHALDLRMGYSNPDSVLFINSDGDIHSNFLNMSSLDPAVLESTAAAMDIYILAFGEIYGPGPSSSSEPPPGPTDPTPRTVPVQYHIVSFGTDMSKAENDQVAAASGGGS